MIIRGEQRRLSSKGTPALTGLGEYADPLIRLQRSYSTEKSGHHLGVSGWIVVMSFRPEAFRLDPFSKVRFWRGCLSFLLKRRKPFA